MPEHNRNYSQQLHSWENKNISSKSYKREPVAGHLNNYTANTINNYNTHNNYFTIVPDQSGKKSIQKDFRDSKEYSKN